MTAMMNRVSQLGVYVAQTGDSSVFEPGDMIVSIDGTDVSSAAEIKEAVNSHNVGDTITVSVIRGNSRQDVEVNIQEAKQ
jgi:serine protease Do